MKTELIVKFQMAASHSLEGYETPHSHLWNLEIILSGSPKNGKIIDLIEFREKVNSVISPLESQYLNDCPSVTLEVRKFPTCETLCSFFHERVSDLIQKQWAQENPSLRLSSIEVAICEMDGTETGAVKLSE
jgi:6-pyruvoyl-tetrahydropterin synthase